MEPYLSYYDRHRILPVAQLTIDPMFLQRRNFLYTSLGVPLETLQGQDILEFGPGGGFNAEATGFFLPNLYTFVDYNELSIQYLHEKSKSKKIKADKVEIHKKRILEFSSKNRFDLVICEGTIPGQFSPTKSLKHISKFVKKGGKIITTCTSYSSYLSEVCRRIFYAHIINYSDSYQSRVEFAVNIFDKHLEQLGTNTRSASDWVQDVILHPWIPGSIMKFSIAETIQTLKENFVFSGSFPQFYLDGSFYKSVSDGCQINDLVSEKSAELALALLDYRIPMETALSRTISIDLESACKALMELHLRMIQDLSYELLPDFMLALDEIQKKLPLGFEPTKKSISNFIEQFPKFISRNSTSNLEEFSKWWGRGQQYVSLSRIN